VIEMYWEGEKVLIPGGAGYFKVEGIRMETDT